MGEEPSLARLSIRGYARHRKVSHTAVRKALADGRITAGVDGRIDPAAADQQWASSTDLAKPRNSVTGVPKKRRTPGAPSDPIGAIGSGAGEALNGAPAGDAARLVSSYAASRAAREGFAARLAKLEFEERSGKLVDADQVRAQIFALGRRARDSLLGVPDRLAPILAGETDQAVIHRLLTEEINRGLAELTSGPPIKADARGRTRWNAV
jgi:hypothetical protein